MTLNSEGEMIQDIFYKALIFRVHHKKSMIASTHCFIDSFELSIIKCSWSHCLYSRVMTAFQSGSFNPSISEILFSIRVR